MNLIKESISDYKKHFADIFPLSVVFQVLIITPTLVNNFFQTFDSLGISYIRLAIQVLAYAIGFTFLLTLQASIIRNEYNFSKQISIAKSLLIPYFLLAFIRTIVMIPGYIFFVIPGMILSLALNFTDYALIDKNVKGFQSLVFSSELTKKKLTYIFSVFFLSSLVIVLPGLILNKLVSVMQNDFLTLVTNASYQAFALPISLLYSNKIYQELKKEKDINSFDLNKGRNIYRILFVLGIIAIPVLFMGLMYLIFTFKK